MNLFYIPEISAENTAFLNEEESRHCIKVLRMQVGDIVQFTDGKGHFFNATISGASHKKTQLHIIEKTAVPRQTPRLHIAIAPTKNINRTEWFLEKATEIGIYKITPVYSFHSERKVIKPERLEKILVSAMKQSLKARLPILEQELSFTDYIQNENEKNRYFAYCGEMDKRLLQQIYPVGEDATILIGPEGGFSPEEAALAISHGWKPVSLGSARLRTETAGIAACHTFNMLNETEIYTIKE
ncbi:MAG: 16S rRNA (uracil(1498)-N(3))-methyltransferase [Marinilabiliales bacterium]|nr:MAG: 16S rRNA (uracil(1498)-N(3))-methyltransferase [Marinilabiliales bacterium]